MTVRIDYYYKNKTTGELVLVTGFSAGWINCKIDRKVMFKEPVTNYVMLQNIDDFIVEYMEYNP